MAQIKSKQFQYAGSDDFDDTIDTQLNNYLDQEGIQAEDVLSIKYEGHAALGVNTYSVLLVYKKK